MTRRRIEDGEAVVQIRPLGRSTSFSTVWLSSLRAGLLVGAVIAAEDALVLALVGLAGGLAPAVVAPVVAPPERPGGAPVMRIDELQPASVRASAATRASFLLAARRSSQWASHGHAAASFALPLAGEGVTVLPTP